MISAALINHANHMDLGRLGQVQHVQDYQQIVDEVFALLEKERIILQEKLALFQRENARDRKRKWFELYDQYYKKIMAAVGGVAVVAMAAAGASAYVTFTNPSLTTAQLFALLSGPVTSAFLTGSGLGSLLIRAGYFMDCNGKFQEMRRGRDAVKQALVQIEDYRRTEQLRAINQQLLAFSPVQFRWRARWKVRRLFGKIQRLEQQVGRYVEKMNRRDHQMLKKVSDDVGGIPSESLRRIEAKNIAKKEFEKLGLEAYVPYFIDPEGELLTGKQSWKQKVFQRSQRVCKKIRQTLPSSPTPKPLTMREQLQQTCERMRRELTAGPNFSALYQLTQQEIARSRQALLGR